ncbi:NADPH-dependent F420 reductase [Saccharopolyspora elongata]|uniref:NADPH-dependent F420 reductase n=1 Tax=Saccharopolyspora elongata TaxID=2530387 RepID=A0A4R4YC38_9PSEU|nr:NADPH-dependent F420 reductase [Saccharopolyspora elongata]
MPSSPAEAQLDIADLVVGVLGGTGDQGRGLARRFGLAGSEVLIGSRSADRARSIARDLPVATGMDNTECAARADLVIVAVPWDSHAALLSEVGGELAGKIIVDCVVPMGFDKRGAHALDVPEGSACLQAQQICPMSRVVGAFHHVSAALLLDPSVPRVETDVMVVGDDRAATDAVIELVGTIPGMRGIYAGRLRNSRQVEALTANLISINRRYRVHAGLRVTDVPGIPAH